MPIHWIRRVRRSFSAKIFLLVVGSVIVTSVVIGVVTTRGTSAFLRHKTGEKFPSVLTSARARVRSWYTWQFRDIERVGNAATVHTLLDRIEEGRRADAAREELSRYLAYVQSGFRVYDALLILDPRGNPIAASDSIDADLGELRDDIAGAPRDPHVSPAQPDRDAERVVQWILVPLMREQKLRGWCVARVDLSALEKVLDELHVDPGSELYVLDGLGRFVTAPMPGAASWRGRFAIQVPTRETGPPHVTVRENYDGRRVFHAKTYLPETGWWLVYEEDYASAMAPLVSAQRRAWAGVLIVMLLALIAAARIVSSILRPIHDLALGARQVNEGLVAVRVRRGGDDEIGYLIDTFNEMAREISISQVRLQKLNKELYNQYAQVEKANKRLEELSITDGLTGLFNHRHFWNLLNTELTRAEEKNGSLVLAMIDLDDFKQVNDRYGHAVGDLVLQSVARVLRESVRDTDIVARYGGEEFAVLMPDTDLEKRGVKEVAEHIRRRVEALRVQVPDTDITLGITVSIGLSVYRGDRRAFFNEADRALYRSKSEGKNRLHVFVPDDTPAGAAPAGGMPDAALVAARSGAAAASAAGRVETEAAAPESANDGHGSDGSAADASSQAPAAAGESTNESARGQAKKKPSKRAKTGRTSGGAAGGRKPSSRSSRTKKKP